MCTGSVTALLPVGQEQRFIVRSCVTCGVEFSQPVKKGRTRFACSKECRIEYLKLYNRSRISRKRQGIEPKRETVIEWSRCLGCGKLMAYAKAMQRKWCSDGCRDAWDADALAMERRRFESRPFTFKLSLHAARSRQYKERASVPCSSCGAVIILGIYGAKQYKKCGRVFCDNECGGLWKSRAYNGRITSWTLDKMAESAMVRKLRQKEKCEKRHREYRCCIACGVAHRSPEPQLHCGCQGRAGMQTCLECGKVTYLEKHAGKLYCSARCSQRVAKRQRRRRFRRNGKSQRIRLFQLGSKHGWKCAMCGVRCHQTQDCRDLKQATIDHIVPVSKGGTNTLNNVQLLCRKCNCFIKRDSLQAGNPGR